MNSFLRVSGVTVALAVAFALAMIALLASPNFPNIYNSDLLHPYLVVQDITRNLSAIWTWNHSPALYVFPDWLLAFVVERVPVPNAIWPIVAATAIYLGYCILGGQVAAAVNGRSVWVNTLALAVLLLACLALGLLTMGTRGSWMLAIAAAPYVHTGSTLSTLAASWFLMRWWGDRRPAWLVAIAVLSVVATASDPVYVAWFAGPAAVVLVIGLALKKSRAGLWALAAVLVPTIVTYGLESRLNRNRSAYMSSTMPVEQSLIAFIDSVVHLLVTADWLIILLLAVFVLGVVAAFRAVFTSFRARRITVKDAYLLFFAGSTTALFAAPILTGLFTHPDLWRYFVGLPVFVAVWLVAVLPWPDGSGRAPWRFVIPGLIVLLTAANVAVVAARPFDIDRLEPLTACLHANDLTAGLGDYWSAKKEIFLSDRQIMLAQIGTDGTRYAFNYNLAWYDAVAAQGANFIVTTNLDEPKLAERFGAPMRIVQCPTDTVWLYDHALQF